MDRAGIVERQEGWCLWCEGALGESFALHHRKLRKHGGPDSPENVVALHHECHNLGTASVHLSPKIGYNRGFLVHSWDEPAKVSLTTPSGTVLLREDGTQREERKHGW